MNTNVRTPIDGIVANVLQVVDVDDAVRRIVASTDGSQAIVRPDRRFTTDVPTTVVRRAERRLTTTRAANMIAHRTDETAEQVLDRHHLTRSNANAPRALEDEMIAVHARKG